MPELPEVESVRRHFEHAALGRTIAHARLIRADYLTVTTPRPPRITPSDALLLNHRISSLIRRGKQLALLTAKGPCLVVQLGMSGEVVILTRTTPVLPSEAVAADSALPPHTHAHLTLENGTRILFRDPRRFGHLTWYPDLDTLHARRWNLLGPDALNISTHQLAAVLVTTTRPVKAALLDQALLAGVGNIYADEALHLAALHPNRPAHRLKPAELDRLAHAIRHILGSAVNAGGSTVSTYRSPAGDTGEYQLAHRVYARAGLPCLTCQSALRSAQIAQRTTVWCPTCQPRRPTPDPPIKSPPPAPTIHTRFTPAQPVPSPSYRPMSPKHARVESSS